MMRLEHHVKASINNSKVVSKDKYTALKLENEKLREENAMLEEACDYWQTEYEETNQIVVRNLVNVEKCKGK